MSTKDTAERREKALELHLAGATYESIAASLGYANRSGAHQAVQEAFKTRAADPNMSEAVRLELTRLDAMLTGLWAKARRGDVQAIDRVMRISERRTQLLTIQQQNTPAVTEESTVDALAARRAARHAATSGQ